MLRLYLASMTSFVTFLIITSVLVTSPVPAEMEQGTPPNRISAPETLDTPETQCLQERDLEQ